MLPIISYLIYYKTNLSNRYRYYTYLINKVLLIIITFILLLKLQYFIIYIIFGF